MINLRAWRRSLPSDAAAAAAAAAGRPPRQI
jgi:hypothetical protein